MNTSVASTIQQFTVSKVCLFEHCPSFGNKSMLMLQEESEESTVTSWRAGRCLVLIELSGVATVEHWWLKPETLHGFDFR